MGNQIAHTPNQILNVRTCLNDLSGFKYLENLGVTRFLKVAKVEISTGHCVAKIFQIVDQSLPYEQYKAKINDIYRTLHINDLTPPSLKNCLPFEITGRQDRTIILLRPYIKDNLFYRLQTRPYLTRIEKKWIAFQLLIALNHIHNLKIAHGDLKIENILLTSYNWVLLSDFANFKPTFFSYEDPAEYYYYFNASQRNACYLAPERFYDQTRIRNDINNDTFSTSFGELGNAAMDIFSVGCILAELFVEQPLFTLTQMLDYRNNRYDPIPIISKIADADIQDMIATMIDRDPSRRHTAEQYLAEQMGKAFPSCFYTFLLPYVERILKDFSTDFVIFKLHRDFPNIINSLNINNINNNNVNEGSQSSDEERQHESSQCLLILLTLALSCMRKLKHLQSRLVALELLRSMIPLVDDDIILDRILPYVNAMINDEYPRVRADAIRTLVFAISSVTNVTQENADLFSEYLFPTLSTTAIQDDCYVRANLAKYLSLLAEYSLKFLEKTYLIEERNHTITNDYFKPYEEELKSVQTWMQGKFSDLIQSENDDQNSQLSEAVCRSDLIRLCTFFGKRKTIEVICGHLTTLLTRPNWRLRATLFDSLITVASYIGLESESFISPLLEQGLSDEEEFVVHRVLKALADLVRLSLLKSKTIDSFLKQVIPLLCHPNLWLRLSVIEFINSICEKSHLAYIHGFIIPVIEPFLKYSIVQVGNAEILYNALIEPLSRDIFDHAQRMQPMENVFRYLSERSDVRKLTGTGLKPAYVEPSDSTVHSAFKKLVDLGMTEEDEDKILALKVFLKNSPQSKLNMGASTETTNRPGTINIKAPPGRRFDLSSFVNRTTTENYPNKHLNNDGSDWSEMFGAVTSQVPNQQENDQSNATSNTSDDTVQEQNEETIATEGAQHSLPSSEDMTQHSLYHFTESGSNIKRTVLRLNCINERHNLLVKQTAICREDSQRKNLEKRLAPTSVFEIKDQRFLQFQGVLHGHVHVHNGKITRLASTLISANSAYTQLFATGDTKGAVRLWNINNLQKSLVFRPTRTIRGTASPIRGLAFASENNLHLSVLCENGQLNIFDVDSSTSDAREPLYNIKLDVTDVGVPIDLKHFDTGAKNIFTLATSQGLIVGIDPRCSTPIFRFKNDLEHRLITALEVDELQTWLAVGTGSGYIDIWDMRFQLCVQTIKHPTGARVTSLLRHQDQPNSLISSFQGNNEVAIWNIDKPQTRLKVFWPSVATPLSLTKSINHYVASMYLWKNDRGTSLLCGGTDMRIRNWNLTDPMGSYMVCRGPADDDNSAVRYQSKTIDGIQVTIEEYHRRTSTTPANAATTELKTTKSSVAIPPAHTDTIAGMQIVMANERIPYLITAAWDSVVKIWR